MPKSFKGEMPTKESKGTIPEPIKNLGEFTNKFTFEPGEKLIISSIFEGVREKEEPINTQLRFESTAPVMEALSLRLKGLYEEAFDEQGKMLNYDRVLDIRGLLLFLMDFYDSAKSGGHKINEENLHALEDALSDLNKFVKQDPYS